MVTVAVGTVHHSASLWTLIPVLVAMAFIFAAAIYRNRRGGPGPGVRWVPRSMRQRVNQRYARKGWQLPYDAQGNRNPARTEL